MDEQSENEDGPDDELDDIGILSIYLDIRYYHMVLLNNMVSSYNYVS
jgi:hypothetical protein